MNIRKPWYRASKDAWYVEINGKQVRLAKGKKNKAQAETAYFRLMAGSGQSQGEHGGQPPLLCVTVCDQFLDHSQLYNAESTYQWHKFILSRFAKDNRTLLANAIRPFHVSNWVNSQKNWTTCKRTAIGIVQRVFSWAKSQGLIQENPLAGMKKPPQRRRERVVTEEERNQILSLIRDAEFRDFVIALQQTGCRPAEVANVTAANVDVQNGLWVLKQHKTLHKTGKPRIIYLTPSMLEMSKRLMQKHPDGPLFRSSRGRAFSRNAIRCRFKRLRDKSPNLKGVVAYSYRHAFATDALVQGVGIAQVAELMGHTSTEMVSRVYSHISMNVGHLREAAVRATQAPPTAS